MPPLIEEVPDRAEELPQRTNIIRPHNKKRLPRLWDSLVVLQFFRSRLITLVPDRFLQWLALGVIALRGLHCLRLGIAQAEQGIRHVVVRQVEFLGRYS